MVIMASTINTQDLDDCEDCEFDGRYVCASSGITYPNSCFARCAGDTTIIEGICLKRCDCLDVFKPVCGYDGQTYRNACTALCQGTRVFD